jgi:hypothetical protein
MSGPDPAWRKPGGSRGARQVRAVTTSSIRPWVRGARGRRDRSPYRRSLAPTRPARHLGMAKQVDDAGPSGGRTLQPLGLLTKLVGYTVPTDPGPGVAWSFLEESPLAPAFVRTGGRRKGNGGSGVFLGKQAGPHVSAARGRHRASRVSGEENEGTEVRPCWFHSWHLNRGTAMRVSPEAIGEEYLCGWVTAGCCPLQH